ncbi:MAG: hypothetical protein M4579_000220 [Chaenotheca gracillima]|nr:MAG: hypothetical protein M4579_000220 [Chaenotheca gracillima]
MATARPARSQETLSVKISVSSIVFDYEGMHYDSQASQPQCGHEGGGFEAFSSSIQAVCYFNTNA